MEQLVAAYDERFQDAQKLTEKFFHYKMEGRRKSWLHPIEEEKEEAIRKISDKLNCS